MAHVNISEAGHKRVIQELIELNQVRLEDNLTYRQLEELTGISYRTLYQLLTSETPRPYDRTLHRIRKFLDQRAKRQRRRA